MSIELNIFQQEKDNTCALACLRMVLAVYGVEVEESTLESEARMLPAGTEIAELERLARHFGLAAEIQETTVEELERLLADGKFAISYIDRVMFELSPAQRAEHSIRNAKMHAVIPTRVTDASVFCHDPMFPIVRRRSKRLFALALGKLGNASVVCAKKVTE